MSGVGCGGVGNGGEAVSIGGYEVLKVLKVQCQCLYNVTEPGITVLRHHIQIEGVVRVITAQLQVEGNLVVRIIVEGYATVEGPCVTAVDEQMLCGSDACPAILECRGASKECALLPRLVNILVHIPGEVVFEGSAGAHKAIKGYAVAVVRIITCHDLCTANIADTIAVCIRMTGTYKLHLLNQQVIQIPVVHTLLSCHQERVLFAAGLKQYCYMRRMGFGIIGNRRKVVRILGHKIIKICEIQLHSFLHGTVTGILSLCCHLKIEDSGSVFVAQHQVKGYLIEPALIKGHTAILSPIMHAVNKHMLIGGNVCLAILQNRSAVEEGRLVPRLGNALIDIFGKIVFKNSCNARVAFECYTVIKILFRIHCSAAKITNAVSIPINMSGADLPHFGNLQIVDQPVVIAAVSGNNQCICLCIRRKQDFNMCPIAILAVTDRRKIVRILGHQLLKIHEVQRQCFLHITVSGITIFCYYKQFKVTVCKIIAQLQVERHFIGSTLCKRHRAVHTPVMHTPGEQMFIRGQACCALTQFSHAAVKCALMPYLGYTLIQFFAEIIAEYDILGFVAFKVDSIIVIILCNIDRRGDIRDIEVVQQPLVIAHAFGYDYKARVVIALKANLHMGNSCLAVVFDGSKAVSILLDKVIILVRLLLSIQIGKVHNQGILCRTETGIRISLLHHIQIEYLLCAGIAQLQIKAHNIAVILLELHTAEVFPVFEPAKSE